MKKNITGRNFLKMRGHGYTLVEMLIAFGLFGLFFGGLFALYSMGTNMFLTGTWRLNKQKEAQRFLSVLKERLEQASNLSFINPAAIGNDQVKVANTHVYTLDKTTTISNIAKLTVPQKILLFTIGKPDTSLAGGKSGLNYSQALWVINGGLELFGTKDGNLASISSSIAGFPPDPSALIGGKWDATAQEYQLRNDPFDLILTDVASLTLTWNTASGTGDIDSGKTWAIKIDFVNPRNLQTSLTQSIQARVSFDVAIENAKGKL